MARLPYVEMQDALPEVREIYETALRGKPGSVQKLLAHRPEVLRTFLAFYGTVGRTLDRRIYEMVYIRVSMINGCHYCLQHHLAVIEARRPDGNRLAGVEGRRLLELRSQGAGRAQLCREADA